MFDEILERHPFFQRLKAEQIREIALHCEQVSFEPGEYLFKEGQPANCFYLILHGQVAIEIHDPGCDPLIVQTLVDDDLLGWSWFFPPYRWHFDTRAVNAVRLLAFDGAWLRQQITADPELGTIFLTQVTRIIFDRLLATRLQLMDIYAQKPATPERRNIYDRPGVN